jgi:hypothetical protein
MANKTGGPAFPWGTPSIPVSGHPGTYTGGGGSSGMSLRDYFAAAALQGAMANERLLPSTESELSHLAMRVYEMADALLAERERQP